MEFKVFQGIVNEISTQKPKLFALGHDKIPNATEIKHIQSYYQIQLPEKYIQFILNYGGGYFGYANIYSLDQDSEFYLFRHNTTPITDYLFIADNGCGDNYAFRLENGKCEEEVFFFEHDSHSISKTAFADILEFLIGNGLQ